MDTELLLTSTSPPIPEPASLSTSTRSNEQTSSFDSAWQPIDQSALLPANLERPKTHRAWDRKPQSPFSRRRLRVGKVWKRANTHAGPSLSFQSTNLHSHASPAKAIKKMCFDSGFGVGAQVRDWEVRGSPVSRRIVTRSLATGDETDSLLALPDTENAEDAQEDVTVHVINEDGTVELSSVEATGAGEHTEWSDVSDEENEEIDATSLEPTEASEHATDTGSEIVKSTAAGVEVGGSADEVQIQIDSEEPTRMETDITNSVANADAEAEQQPQAAPPSRNQDLEQMDNFGRCMESPVRKVTLPDGFVSPAVPHRQRSIKQARSTTTASRRRTLPVNFAATSILHSRAAEIPSVTDATEALESTKPTTKEDATTLDRHIQPIELNSSAISPESQKVLVADVPEEMMGDEEDWEDIETDNLISEDVEAKDTDFQPLAQFTVTTATESESIPPVSPHSIPPQTISDNVNRLATSPSRRTVRRQSSSPTKQSTIWPTSERSHLIAFTPVKMPSFSFTADHLDAASCSPVTGTLLQHNDTTESPVPNITRCSSAPPEEPRMSPQKPRQPRISDDTALLQAFLNRAAETRTSRRVSETARRESLENRRDSDSVRRALASTEVVPSPAPATVLVDLDPNSPSPRKAIVVAENEELRTNTKLDANADEDDDITLSSPARKTNSRRSVRVKKKPETLAPTTYTAPNKISIRANTDSVVLKRSEAQELALLTRNNTRKNKGGSVLPPLRLTKIARDLSPNESGDAPDEVETKRIKAGRKGVQWAETLTAFHHYAPESDELQVSDEATETLPALSATELDAETIEVSSTTPAVEETANASKARRLKAPRMHATPAKVTFESIKSSEPEEAAPESATVAEVKPRTAKRKSRIATPAKPRGLSARSLMDEQEDGLKAPAQLPSKSKLISKLPAPSSTMSSSASANGKEGSLIASPPKKRFRPVSSSIAPRFSAAPVNARHSISNLDVTNPAISFDAGQRSHDAHSIPSLASPAKKASGTYFFGGGDDTITSLKWGDADSVQAPGLGSPAKKRTRRTGR